jgi:hypothetical protein
MDHVKFVYKMYFGLPSTLTMNDQPNLQQLLMCISLQHVGALSTDLYALVEKVL